MVLHPLVASRTCEDCKKWWYDEKTGKVHQRRGKPCLRPCPVPCDTAVGCPKGHYSNQKSLSARNVMAYLHHKECEAVNSWPDDSVVRYNARLIRMVESGAEKLDEYKNLERMMSLAMGGARER